MNVEDRPLHYHAYMIRMWEERPQAKRHWPTWHFQLEDPHTGRRRGFVDLAALLAYLQTVVTHDDGVGIASD